MAKKTDDSQVETHDDNQADDALDAKLDAKLNAALTNHMKRLSASLEKRFESISASLQPKEPEAPAAPDDVAGKVAALEKLLLNERRAREEAETAREAERQARNRQEEDSMLASSLRDAGITAPDVADAVHALLRTKGKVARDESGEVRFKTMDKYGSEQLLPLKEGLGQWVKNEGKAFLPAVPVRGTGATKTGVGKDAQRSGKEDAKAEARNVLAELLGTDNEDEDEM